MTPEDALADATLALAPFDVHEPIGRGGMGEVRRGVHAPSGLPVAVKFVRSEPAPGWHQAFQREVRAVAALDHAGIVAVYDHGLVPGGVVGLEAGTPYLVMELASGSLRTSRVRTWPEVRGILLDILEALGHAHARGVVHRDLKPANVLVRDDGSYVLTDFGIAHAAGSTDEVGMAGTPNYMAPEQFRGRWRDQGPWTDLYALGCTAWHLITGQSPYGDTDDITLVRRGHLQRDPPPLLARLAVPSGLEGWLVALLEKDPAARPACAADAAAALRELGEPAEGATFVGGGARHELPTFATLSPTLGSDLSTDEALPIVVPAAPSRLGPAPFRADWRGSAAPRRIDLVGAGLNLYGLRPVRVVGREGDQDLLWQALADVHATGRCGVVVLRGPAGAGKSHLCGWLCERAAELGAATTLRATWAPAAGPSHGFPAMVARALRAEGLEGEDAIAHAEAGLTRLGIADRDLAHLVVAAPHGLLRRLLVAVGAGRPSILWLDDVQWGPEALAFVRWLLDQREISPVPVLVVCAARDEALAEAPDVEAALEALCARPGATLRRLPPLDDAGRRALIRELLGLERTLAERVEVGTGGNPSFAVQLVGDWVRRGVLVPGPRGFELTDHDRAAIPSDLAAAWSHRIGRLVDDHPGWRDAIELAATLGTEVDVDEWRRACQIAGVPLERELIDALEADHTGRLEGTRFVLVQAMLRETVLAVARSEGRAADRHASCARMLEGHPEARSRGERLGLHLLHAGEREAAEAWIRQAAAARHDRDELRQFSWLMDQWELAAADVLPEDDRRWVEGRMLASIARANVNELDAAVVYAEQAAAVARRNAWHDVLGRALRIEAQVHLRAGALSRARAVVEEALGLSVEPYMRSVTLRILGNVAQAQGDLDVARRAHLESLDIPETDDFGRSSAVNSLADIARLEGDLDAAAAGYEQASAMTDIPHADAWVARLNLAFVRVQQRRFAEASAIVEPVREICEREAWSFPLTAALICQLACNAHAGRWFAWDTTFARSIQMLAATGMVDPDFARMLDMAAELAHEAGQVDRARSAREAAAEHWRKLRRPEGV